MITSALFQVRWSLDKYACQMHEQIEWREHVFMIFT